MIRTMLAALSLAILLVAAGCSKESSDRKAAGDNKIEKKSAVEAAEKSWPQETSKPNRENASGEPPELVIKTDNRVSDQEADAMLDEVDKQLTELMNTLDLLDDLDEKELQY